MLRLPRLVAAVLALALAPGPAQADAVADFYKGKTVRVIIGTGVGGTYGVYGQLVARHFGRFIPGNPTVVMQSMQGAGGFTALNWLGTTAPRDGTVVTIGHINIVHEGLFNAEAKFDPRGFLWLGRFTSFASVGVASKKSGIRSLADAKAREVAAGAPGAQSVPATGADHPQPHRRHEIQGRRRLSLDRRELPGAGARRGRRGGDLDGRAALAALAEARKRRTDPDLRAGRAAAEGIPQCADLGRIRQQRGREGVPRRVQRDRGGRPLAGDAARRSGRSAGGAARGLPGDGRRSRVPRRHQEARHRARPVARRGAAGGDRRVDEDVAGRRRSRRASSTKTCSKAH